MSSFNFYAVVSLLCLILALWVFIEGRIVEGMLLLLFGRSYALNMDLDMIKRHLGIGEKPKKDELKK